MIPIRKGFAPREFLEWRRENPTATFEDLSGVPKEAVQKSLCKEQGYLCAYCMRQINDRGYHERYNPNGMKIEHVKPRSKYPELQLDYRNLVAVCGGNEESKTEPVLAGKRRPEIRLVRTCDTSKEDLILRAIDPLNEQTILGRRGISYKLSQGLILSTDSDKDFDINTVLNLNGRLKPDEPFEDTLRNSPLIRGRKATWEKVHNLAQRELRGKGDKAALRYFKDKLRKYENESDHKTRYVGVTLYYLRRCIKHLEKYGN